MYEHRYTLEPYKGMNTRYHCPGCKQKEKTFVRYIDMKTGTHVDSSVGRCNRESNCGYHYTPKQYFQDNNISVDTPYLYSAKTIKPQQKPVSYIPVDIFKASLKGHETNSFIRYLINLFGEDITSQLIGKYFIGTSKYWPGASVFWQIDISGKVRTGKIMLYNDTTGKRVKEPCNCINWAHIALKWHEFDLKQCLFGEHLLQNSIKCIALVESEKTAIISSVYLPQFVWLSVGSLTSLNVEKCQVLKGRNITLFPDLNGFEKWSKKAKELSSHFVGTTFNVSDLLERKATESERKQGLDLADYLIRFSPKDFGIVFPEPKQDEQLTVISPLVELKQSEQIKTNYSFGNPVSTKNESWDQVITELETFFTGMTLTTQPIKLNPCSTITDVSIFIDSHFATVKANNGNRTFLPYLQRMQELKEYLNTNIN